ncbi:MAG: PilZ domain-containing protein [Solirubrobacteraceae bacterium]
MRRLVKNQAVRVDLDAKVDWEVDSIECRVQSIQGPVATLIPEGELDDGVQTRLTSGSLCFLTFEHGRAPVALRGVALKAADREELEFVVVDGIQVAERRSAERTPLVTAVRATPVGPGGDVGDAVATVTSNLSMGGALLLKRPGLGEVSKWRVELFLPGDPDHVYCEAVLARETPTHLGVRLVNVQEADQLRIAGVLAGLQRATPALA